jgi:hypothetical protein
VASPVYLGFWALGALSVSKRGSKQLEAAEQFQRGVSGRFHSFIIYLGTGKYHSTEYPSFVARLCLFFVSVKKKRAGPEQRLGGLVGYAHGGRCSACASLPGF